MGCGSSAARKTISANHDSSFAVPTLCFRGVSDADARKWCFSVLLACDQGSAPVLKVDGHDLALTNM